MRLRARVAFLAAVVAAWLPVLAAPASAAGCANADLVPSAANAPLVRGAVRCLINVERRSRGRVALQANRELRRAAERYAKLMVQQRFSAHVSPGGSTVSSRIRRSGYLDGAARWVLGENLGDGEDPDSTPRELVDAWMASRSHRTHILTGEYRDVGVGVVRGTPQRGDGPGATYCVEFGRRYKR